MPSLSLLPERLGLDTLEQRLLQLIDVGIPIIVLNSLERYG